MCCFRRRHLTGSWIQLLVLRVLYETPMHGYRLMQEVNRLLAGRRTLKPGSLYTILRRMEQGGLLESEWEGAQTGLDRRVYRVSERGVEMLRAGRRMVEEQRRVLEEMAEFYRRHFEAEEDVRG
ncbi:PadR family transcriptional regulator [Candidatus Bathyarchaeota archaeon]|nr:MAG: PadR family transcriptional regulator [Candidatus Bathyarchaeota archaeon]